MRIVTRADLDGAVCAVLLFDKEPVEETVFWVEPSELQKNLVTIKKGDILANLPYHNACEMWFDHHVTNQNTLKPFKGAFEIAPSAAGIIYRYYKKEFSFDYAELIEQTDRIDSANLTLNEVEHPESNPYLLLSMTLSSRSKEDEPYWNHVVNLLRANTIAEILSDPEVKERCDKVIEQNKAYKKLLKTHTTLNHHVSLTDFRTFEKSPRGNRFLVYSIFPETTVNVKISNHFDDPTKMIISVGHSIFNKKCHVNVGLMLANYEGGGHRGAGSCSFSKDKLDLYLNRIIQQLLADQSNEA